MPSVRGCRILIVEDEYLLATDLSRYFKKMGAVVLGPVSSLKAAGAAVDKADAAILDIDLNGERVFPLADELERRGVPFIFFSGYSDIIIPPRFQHAAQLSKPVRWDVLFEALFPRQEPQRDEASDTVVAMLPRLRLCALLMMGDASAADRLVELTLERAIETIDTRSSDVSVEAWLNTLLEDTHRRHGRDLLQ